MQESIFRSGLRSFFMTLFGMIGLCFGIIPFFLTIALLFSGTTGETKAKNNYTFEIVPNAEGSRKVLSKDAPVILMLNIHGIIGTDLLSTSSVQQQLTESREGDYKNDRVKAVLLNINSPGGTVVDSDGIYRAIKAYKAFYKVPVYAYVDGLCASGGMYIAASADKIFATNVSVIGSVGVLAPTFMNFTTLLGKVGVETLSISAGKGKDELNPLRPWTKDEGANVRQLIDSFYADFVNLIVSNRPEVNKEKLIEEYGARVFTAEKAKEIGFIDQSNQSLNEVIKLLAKEIGIEDNYYQVIQPEGKTWLSALFSEKNSLFRGEIIHKMDFGPEFSSRLRNQFLYLYQPE